VAVCRRAGERRRRRAGAPVGGARADGGMRGRAQVLTTGSWPTQMAARCSLPRELEACCEDFRAFYLASHSGRKLSWQTNMGNAGARPARPPCVVRAMLARRHAFWPSQSGVQERRLRLCARIAPGVGIRPLMEREWTLAARPRHNAVARRKRAPLIESARGRGVDGVCAAHRPEGHVRQQAARAQREHVPDGCPAALQCGRPAELPRDPGRDRDRARGPAALAAVAFRAACPAGKYGDCARRRLRRPGAHAAVSGAAPSRRAPRRPDEDSLLTYTVQRMLERVLLLLLFSRSGRHPAGSATALRRRPRSACPSGAAPRRAAAAWAAAGAGGAWRLRASRPG